MAAAAIRYNMPRERRIFVKRKNRTLTYPLNLWSDVFARSVTEAELPEDWEETVHNLFHALSNPHHARKREIETILFLYYRDGHTAGQIADLHHTTSLAIFEAIQGAIRRLQQAPMCHYLQCGLKAMSCRQITEDDKVTVLSLPTLVSNAVQRGGYITVGQLLQCTEADLLSIRGFGQKSIPYIKTALAAHGLSLRT